MDKKIGRYFFVDIDSIFMDCICSEQIRYYFLLLCIFTCTASVIASTTINLRITDTSGHKISEAVLGIPFLLEVVVEGQEQDVQTVNVAGLVPFHAQNYGTMSSITQVNGVVSAKKTYRYKLRSNKKGTYTVGPAFVATSAGTIHSEPLSFTVLEEQSQQHKQPEIKLKLITDKKSVVVGERVPVTIRLYADPEYKLHGLYPSDTQLKTETGSIDGPRVGSEKNNGQTVAYKEWQTDYTPKESGTLIIPAFKVDYASKKRDHADAFDMMMQFNDLFGHRYEYQHVYSNPLVITVDALPAYHEPITAIGSFTHLSASVDHTHAREGDGIVFSLELQGDGNWSEIQYPALRVPASLKHYESKMTMRAYKKGGVQTKIFEYIIQGMEPGTFEIPEQELTYFDTKERVYKTIKSNPVSISINAFAKPEEEKNVVAKEEINDQNSSVSLVIFKELHTPLPVLPWPLFIVFWLLPTFAYCGYSASCRWQAYKAKNNNYLKKKNAFIQAKKELKKALKHKDLKIAHDGLMQLFADRSSIPAADLTHELIVSILKKNDKNSDVVDQWQLYIHAITEVVFCNKHISTEKKEALLQGALQWVDQLEGRL